MRKFTRNDLQLIEGYSGEAKYVSNVDKKGIHLGQAKLFFSELLFLTRYYERGDILLYIGSSRGKHINYLYELFKGIEIHCYDPSESDIDTSIITEYRKAFNEDDVEKWKKIAKKKRVLLISDIRSFTVDKVRKEKGIDEEERLMKADMDLQMSWVENIQPEVFHLKFRPPYYYKGTEEFEYLDGKVFIEPWNRSSSTEHRLVASKPYKRRIWNFKKYEDMCFYHNLNNRGHDIYYNLIYGDDRHYNKDLTNDADSTITIFTIMKYLVKYDNNDSSSVMSEKILNFYDTAMSKILYSKSISDAIKIRDKDRFIEDEDRFYFKNKTYKLEIFFRYAKKGKMVPIDNITEKEREYIVKNVKNKKLKYIFKWYPLEPSEEYGPIKFKSLSDEGMIDYIENRDFVKNEYYDILDNCDVSKFINYETIDFCNRIFNLIRINDMITNKEVIKTNEKVIDKFFNKCVRLLK